MTEESYTDDADVSQLEHRIDELEATIRKMLPSRREALGMGVAGLAGASLMSGTASAGSSQVGTIGDNSNLVDLVAEDVTITDTLNTASLSSAAADEALLSDGSGNLTFGSVGGVEEVSTFGNLPAIDPPQLAYVNDEEEYYYSRPLTGTPFDIGSASFSTSINTQDSQPRGIAWNNDGSRLYEVGGSSANIYQYTVSTPFDISSASFTPSPHPSTSAPHLSPPPSTRRIRIREVSRGTMMARDSMRWASVPTRSISTPSPHPSTSAPHPSPPPSTRRIRFRKVSRGTMMARDSMRWAKVPTTSTSTPSPPEGGRPSELHRTPTFMQRSAPSPA